MTKEQEILVTENHNLIYWWIHKYNLSVEEYYDVCAIALCKAALTFNKDKGYKFSTYAGMVILNSIKMEFRKFQSNKYIKYVLSLDTTEKYENICLADVCTTGLDTYDEIIPYDLKDILTPFEYEVAQLKVQGYTQIHIGDMLKCSQPKISRALREIRRKMEMG